MFKKAIVPELAQTELTQWALEVATELGKARNADLRIVNVQVPLLFFYPDRLSPEAGEELRVKVD